MSKNEALKAAIDGKKVRNSAFTFSDSYVKWNGTRFVFNGGGGDTSMTEIPYDTVLVFENHWEIVPEYVDFAEAWKAYENGKGLRSCTDGHDWIKEAETEFGRSNMKSFSRNNIRGKWLILEDK